MRVAVVLFPGSNCEHDVVHLYSHILKIPVDVIWHQEKSLGKPDLVIIPGGFAYGDYLRTGALAKLSPVMQEVKKFADKGGPVLGICNGFQILCEAEMLPGVLLQNADRKFLSRFINMRVESLNSPFTRKATLNQVITCPIAHGEGNYFAFPDQLERIEGEGQVIFRYVDKLGESYPDSREVNPNGAINGIAGICNSKRNVVGLMPHPERAAEDRVGFVGGSSGRIVFESVIG